MAKNKNDMIIEANKVYGMYDFSLIGVVDNAGNWFGYGEDSDMADFLERYLVVIGNDGLRAQYKFYVGFHDLSYEVKNVACDFIKYL